MKNYTSLLSALFVVLCISSCKKEFDAPPAQEIPEGGIKSISDLKSMYFSQGRVSFAEDFSTYGVVSADEASGNLYRTLYIQDATDGITLRLQSSGSVYIGDSIRVYLKGLVLDDVNGVISLDSVDVDQNIIKQTVGISLDPLTLTLSSLSDANESKLIKLENVQFTSEWDGETYADGPNKVTVNTTIEDCDGNTLIVRNSGYANFADELLPTGNGSIVGVLSEFNGDRQLFIRDLNDVNMTATRCDGSSGNNGNGGNGGTGNEILYKDFEDLSLTSGGWINQTVIGPHNWEASSFGSDNFARISNYNGSGNDASEAWLISPAIDLSTATSPYLSFDNTYNHPGAPLEVYVSTDYTGSGDPNSASWTQLSFTLSSGSWDWVNSGQVSLSAFLNSNVYIAFKYYGSTSDGSTWEVDNIVVDEL